MYDANILSGWIICTIHLQVKRGDSYSRALEIEGAKLFELRGKSNFFKEWVTDPRGEISSLVRLG